MEIKKQKPINFSINNYELVLIWGCLQHALRHITSEEDKLIKKSIADKLDKSFRQFQGSPSAFYVSLTEEDAQEINIAIHLGIEDGRFARAMKEKDESYGRISLSQIGDQIHILDAILERLTISTTLSDLENRISALEEILQKPAINSRAHN